MDLPPRRNDPRPAQPLHPEELAQNQHSSSTLHGGQTKWHAEPHRHLASARPTFERPTSDRPTSDRPTSDRPTLQWPHEKILHNRVHAVILHIPWYGFRTQARLARDSGVSPAAISRLIRGQSQPSLAVALRITRALSRRLGQSLDVFEVFSLDGTYPTASACHLTGCRNCLPPEAYDQQQNLRPEFQRIAAGEWSLSPLHPTMEKMKGGL